MCVFAQEDSNACVHARLVPKGSRNYKHFLFKGLFTEEAVKHSCQTSVTAMSGGCDWCSLDAALLGKRTPPETRF